MKMERKSGKKADKKAIMSKILVIVVVLSLAVPKILTALLALS